MCEFYQYVKDARHEPVLTMFETIRRQIMCIFQEKREWISKIKSHICPRIAQKLEERKKKVVEFDTIVTNKLAYEMSNISGTFVVNANERICTCHKWEMARIPCVHVCASLIQNRKNSY